MATVHWCNRAQLCVYECARVCVRMCVKLIREVAQSYMLLLGWGWGGGVRQIVSGL